MDAIESFTASIVDNLHKNGFPERKVAFALERMYESAAKKELSFNKVLERLADRGIAHEKTPERIIFSAARAPSAEPPEVAPGAAQGLPFMGLDPSMLDGLGGSLGLEALEGVAPAELMAAATRAAQQMSPEQLEAIRNMVGNMSPEQLSAMMEQAKKLGLG